MARLPNVQFPNEALDLPLSAYRTQYNQNIYDEAGNPLSLEGSLAGEPAANPLASLSETLPAGKVSASPLDIIMGKLRGQQRESAATQKEGIQSLQDRIKKLSETNVEKGGLGAALAMAADTWGGGGGKFSEFRESQNKGLTEAQKQQAITQLENTLRQAKGDLSNSDMDFLKMQLQYELGRNKPDTAATKENRDILKTDESKKIQANINFNNSLDKYETLVKQYGTNVTGKQADLLNSAYSDMLTQYNIGAGLGALAGPDLQLLTSAVRPATGVIGKLGELTGISGGKESVLGSIKQIRDVSKARAQNALESLQAGYGGNPVVSSFDEKVKKIGAQGEDPIEAELRKRGLIK